LRQELYEIWLWAHCSRRATYPPSAAEREFSIAEITLSWGRLTWPALARPGRGREVVDDRLVLVGDIGDGRPPAAA
jgi:hypothetical protein